MQSTQHQEGTKPCCDLMLSWNVMQFHRGEAEQLRRCDLMLSWNVMQLTIAPAPALRSCDLMLSWNVMQWFAQVERRQAVVI